MTTRILFSHVNNREAITSEADFIRKMANSNSHVENVVHNDDPYADIVAAVKKQLEKNNETMIKTLEEKTETRIQDAVKRALEVQETEEATRKKAKKEPDFKSKGNKLRYEVNEEIKKSIEKALKAIERKDYEPAKAALEAGMKIVDKQQKLIRIADREEAGWEVVRHYLSDDLASNSEDEKAINRARKEALATIKKRKTKKKASFRNAPPPLISIKSPITGIKNGVLPVHRTEAEQQSGSVVTDVVRKGISSIIVPLNSENEQSNDEQEPFGRHLNEFGNLTSENEHSDYRNWEFAEGESSCMKFSLRRNFLFWQKMLKPSQFVLNVISQGYILPLTQRPPPFLAKNNSSAKRHPDFVAKAIRKLQAQRLIQKIESPAHCCNPLTVAEKGKLRLVLDLRHVNKFLDRKKVKYEDLRVVAEILEQNDYFVTFDLTSGYHHIDIHPDHHKYLGFSWQFDDGHTEYFQFTVLAFGASPASYVFIKMLRPFTQSGAGKA